jgi:hypothetical protein
MVTIRRYLPACLIAAVLLVSTSACASTHPYYRYPPGARGVDDRAYTEGYRDGRRHGENDARRRRHFDYARHNDFRDADDGYRGHGDPNMYRSMYRQAFITGYEDGYRRYADGYGYPSSRGGYPGSYPGSRGPVGRYTSPAADNGYRDGYAAGRDDARDRDRYDPVRSSRYRSGDHGYNGRYGSRDEYKREYRAAFQRGYDQGFRENRR